MPVHKRVSLVLTLMLILATLFSTPIQAAGEGTYVVKKGDTLYSIARANGISLDELMLRNNISDPTKLQVGVTLQITAPTNNMRQYTVQKNDTLWSIAQAHNVTVQDILTANNMRSETILQIGSVLHIPENKVHPPSTIPSTQPTSLAASVIPLVPETNLNTIELAWPVMGRLTSSFGTRWGSVHEGVDLGVPIGTPVRAAAEGVVSFAAVRGAYGWLVVIEHADGWETYYAHNSQLLVKVGDSVQQGQVIAKSGSSGRTTGPHLHFEVRRNGVPIDPMRYL